MFVTGGSRGLGREMALAIADAGADVVLSGRDAESLGATAEEVGKMGREVATIQADMGNPDECEQACRRGLERYGPWLLYKSDGAEDLTRFGMGGPRY